MRARTETTRPPLVVATVAWTGLILSVTLSRSLPAVSHIATIACEGIALLACVALILRRSTDATTQDEARLAMWMLGVPAVAMALAAYRAEWDNIASPAASAVALIAASRIDWRTRAESAWRALLGLVLASLVLGSVDPAVVEENDRAFMPFLYDGRLFGILQTPNVLGESAVLLVLLSIAAKNGRPRTLGVALGLFAMTAASSQTAIVTGAAAVVLWCIWRTFDAKVALLAAWATAVAAVAWLAWLFMRPVDPLLSTSDLWSGLSFSSRTNIWALLVAQDIPFTGLGQDRLTTVFESTVIPGAAGVSSAHNVALDAYVRDGVPGVLALAVAVIAIGRFVIMRRSWPAAAAAGAFVLEGMLEVTPTHVPYYALFYIAVTAAIPGHRRVSRTHRGRPADRPITVIRARQRQPSACSRRE